MLKHITKSLVIKVLLLFIGAFSVLALSAYLLIKNFLLKHIQINELNTFLYEYHIIWFELFILFLIFGVLMYFLLHAIGKKIEEDISSLNKYLDEINNKNYDAIIKIENYMEFLHSSLLLKNIVKRLKNKEKK